ncbi:MAG TPA: 2-dehydropantoate 2-reductase [Xanthobacteraceae bacterium]|nr:2-dehydropantoate 2-reductase [Xanthobacteraceae bacterium]
MSAAEKRDILVWGAGAIGGTVAAYLARASHRVTCVDASAAHISAIAANGIRISGPVATFTARVAVASPEELNGTWPIALLAVKAQHSLEAALKLREHLAADGVVVTLQNGLSHVETARIVRPRRVFAGMVGFAADVLEPGHIRFGKGGDLVIGEPGRAADARVEECVSVLRDFEPRATTSDNIDASLWGKLGFVAILYGTALGMSPLAKLFTDRRLFPLWYGLAHEFVGVAEAEGIAPVSFDDFDLAAFRPARPTEAAWDCLMTVASRLGLNAKPHSGMWRDLAVHKRRTEIDAQLVPIVALGRRYGLPCRLLDCVCTMIHEIEAGTRVQSDDALSELLAVVDRASTGQMQSKVS